MANLTEQWLANMYAKQGVPYQFGGKRHPERDWGLDCSGLLTSQAPGWFLGNPDFTSADALKQRGAWVSEGGARRGTMVLFHSTYGDFGPAYATHCGVVVRAGWMIDTHDSVHETSFAAGYWRQHLLGFWHPSALAPITEETMADPELVNLIGYLRGDVAQALEDGINGAEAAQTEQEKADAIQALRAALNTLRTA